MLRDALAVYRQRIADMESRDAVAVAFLFKNVGAGAGASIAHNHSQLLGLPEVPPRLVAERAACTRHGCIHCHEIETAAAEGRLIAEDEHHVLLSPSTPKLPFETWLLPRAHGVAFEDEARDASLVGTLRRTLAALHSSFDGAPFNFCLHRLKDADFHWHFEIQPRLGYMAALEIGGDMYINAITPQECVRRWQRV